MSRQTVLKTYKLYIGGKFPRSESGYTAPVKTKSGEVLANICLASRKDARMTVQAARAGFKSWSSKTAFLRSQILYRMAEMLESRAESFVAELTALGQMKPKQAEADVELAIDRLVWYAGWADKFGHILGSQNQVSGPFFNFSVPEPMGVVAVQVPATGSLCSLVSCLAPVLVSGNSVIAVVETDCSTTALSFSEVLAVSDLPAGAVNILSGDGKAVMATLAAHLDVNALCLSAADASLEAAAADSVKRVAVWERDWQQPEAQSPFMIGRFTETKTIWHPAGA